LKGQPAYRQLPLVRYLPSGYECVALPLIASTLRQRAFGDCVLGWALRHQRRGSWPYQ